MSAPGTLALGFLEQRDYLHGTTLFDTLRPQCRDGTGISFRVSRMIRTDRVSAEPFDPEADAASTWASSLVWEQAGARKALGVRPLERSAAPRREPFDEASIVARAKFEGATVSTGEQGAETPVRCIVALNKALLSSVLRPQGAGQWLFVRLDLDRDIERFAELRLTQRTSVGLAAVSSTIEIDGRRAGTVVFSWLKKSS